MDSQQKDCVICKQEPTDINPLRTVREFYQRESQCNHVCQCSTLYCFECSVRNRKKVFPGMSCHVCKKYFGFDMNEIITKGTDRLAFMMNRGAYFWLNNLPMKIIIEHLQRFIRYKNNKYDPHQVIVFQSDELRYLCLSQIYEKMSCIREEYKDVVFNMSLKDFTKNWVFMTVISPVSMIRTKMIDEKVNDYTEKLINTFDDVDDDDDMEIDNIIHGFQGIQGTLYDSLRNLPHNHTRIDNHNEHNQDDDEEEHNHDEDNHDEEEHNQEDDEHGHEDEEYEGTQS